MFSAALKSVTLGREENGCSASPSHNLKVAYTTVLLGIRYLFHTLFSTLVRKINYPNKYVQPF